MPKYWILKLIYLSHTNNLLREMNSVQKEIMVYKSLSFSRLILLVSVVYFKLKTFHIFLKHSCFFIYYSSLLHRKYTKKSKRSNFSTALVTEN